MNLYENKILPTTMITYIKNHFGEDCEIENYFLLKNDDLIYCSNVIKKEKLYHLAFNDEGKLLKQEEKTKTRPVAMENFYGEESYYEHYCD